ncbi:M48 family metallopeptidase [Orenia marismortui]|uniref:M48 family metallopeptidase n=1 Tax=Orenia marismortui TaxID=46469 RepID=UPI00037BC1AA|nr:M48 family metallopeptidase [Orenia marismortui]
MKLEINSKEKLYFVLMLIFSLFIYLGLIFSIIGGFYILIFAIAALISHGVYIGYIKGNGIKVSNKQFPEIYQTAQELSEKLELKRVPSIYILQSGGLLNAFATRFFGRNFVIIYSDVLELAYEEGEEAVAFVVGHELAHLKRKHLRWRYLLYPAMIIPFLAKAYFRACEYTCDQIAFQLRPEGAISGLLVLAAGKKMYKRVNIEEVINQAEEERGFWLCLSEILSTHPHLSKRLTRIYDNKFLFSDESSNSLGI